MDLWIRSQDKELLTKVEGVYYDYQQETHHITVFTNENYHWVGIYKSKERALKVLDEINMLKDFLQYIELLPNNKKWEYLQRIDFKNGDSLTYEMPEE